MIYLLSMALYALDVHFTGDNKVVVVSEDKIRVVQIDEKDIEEGNVDKIVEEVRKKWNK